MADITVVLSGPLTSAGQAGHAVARAGLKVNGTGDRHGLPDEGPAVAWLRAVGDERQLSAAAGAARALGWQVRLHRAAARPAQAVAAAPRGAAAVEALAERVQRLEAKLGGA